MGLQDREYMRHRGRADIADLKLFRPPEPSVKSTLWIVLFFLLFTFLCFKAWNWWQLRKSPPVSAVSRPVRAPVPLPPKQYPNLAGNWDPSRTAPVYSQQSESQGTTQTFTKCVVNGVTSFTDGDCAPNATRSSVSVNPNANLADGLREAPALVIRRTAPQVAQAVPAAESISNPHLEKKLLCNRYEEEIKQIDARARQPLPGSEQDWLAARRKRARDEQFRLRC